LFALLGAGFYLFMLPRFQSHAADVQPNMDCTLIVPDNPLSARGLATPYQLVATNRRLGPCNEANANQSAFVQGVIYDPANGTFSVYNPLIVDHNTRPAITPSVPQIPRGAIVALWFGFNGTNLTLRGAHQDTLAHANCVNGLGESVFGQFAYCNAVAFFAAANQGIVAHKIQIPALQTAKDGLPCPTVRAFSVVDQDQSDNVQTQYLATADGHIAQFSTANQNRLRNATIVGNPSDNALLTNFIDPALGCKPWQVPNLADNNQPVSALPLDELQASAEQGDPAALVPQTDPMVTIVHGNQTQFSLSKTNLYRRGVDQIPATTTQQASGTAYCQNLLNIGMRRLIYDQRLTQNAVSPDPNAANSLFTFLAMRFQTSYTNLNCAALLKIANPVKTKLNGNGTVIAATFTVETPQPRPISTPTDPHHPRH
jgi:hypothetical protein